MNSPDINLNNLTMNAVKTDANGVIGLETLFHFHQEDQKVRAEYRGGKTELG